MHKSSRPENNGQLRRMLERFREKRQEESVKHPLRACIPFLCVAGLVMTGTVSAATLTVCYQVEAQGRSLAFFQDETVYNAALTQAENRASKILQSPYSMGQDLSVSTTLAPKDQVAAVSGVAGSLLESIPELEHVYTLSVDGVRVGAAADAAAITQALNLVKERYTTPETRSLHIDSQVDIRYEYLPTGTGKATPEELVAALLKTAPRTFHYTVQPGDTLASVTALFSMTEERFRALNPDLPLEIQVPPSVGPMDEYLEEEGEPTAESVQTTADGAPEPPQTAKTPQPEEPDLEKLLGDQIWIPLPEGTQITIEQVCPLLLVSTVEEMDLTREIAPALETQEDPTMFVGQQRVVQEGEAGQMEVLARVVKRCGVPVASNDLNTMVRSEPTALIVGTGAKHLPELPEGCLFLWPVQGPITSDFGYRFIFGETNFHRGIDIAAPSGTAINAGADGTVVFAGERGSYGNLVILSHGNGFLTYYAHCSKLLVQAGDTVTQGQPIAAVGSTGRSTGPHCHFEVRYQNELIDPLFYLPGENNAPARPEEPEKEEQEEPPEQEELPPIEQPPSEQPPQQLPEPEEPIKPEEPALPEPPEKPNEGEDPSNGEEPPVQGETEIVP